MARERNSKGQTNRRWTIGAGVDTYPSDHSDHEHERDNGQREQQKQPKGKQPAARTNRGAYAVREYRNIRSWATAEIDNELTAIGAFCDNYENNEDAPPLVFHTDIIALNIQTIGKAIISLSQETNSKNKTERILLYRGLSDQLLRVLYLDSMERKFMCAVCGDRKRATKYPDMITRRCFHHVRTCSSCVKKWAASQLETNGWNRIKCPECSEIMLKEDMEHLASEETYDKYLKLRKRAKDSSHPDWVFCLNPKCDSGHRHSPGEGTLFVCRTCGFKQCTKHGRKWHISETCNQYDARVENKRRSQEIASEKWKAKATKLCYNCRVPIEKNGGCDSMWCK
jgi:hypothetical protein